MREALGSPLRQKDLPQDAKRRISKAAANPPGLRRQAPKVAQRRCPETRALLFMSRLRRRQRATARLGMPREKKMYAMLMVRIASEPPATNYHDPLHRRPKSCWNGIRAG